MQARNRKTPRKDRFLRQNHSAASALDNITSERVLKLTAPVLNRFVDFIKVYHAERFGSCRVQRVDIFYSCVCEIFLPDTDKAPTTVETRMMVRKAVELIAATRESAKAVSTAV